jgi:hypothetical protein
MIDLLFGPTQLESKWIQIENKVSEKLSLFTLTPFVFFILYLVASFAIYHNLLNLSLPAWGRFFIFQDRYWASVVLVGGAFLFRLLSLRLRGKFLFLSFLLIASWFIPLYKLGALGSAALYPLLFIGACLFILQFLQNKMLCISSFIGFYLLLNWGLYESAVRTHNGKILQYFSVLHLDVILLYFINRLFAGKDLNRLFDLNPLQLFAPLPIPRDSQVLESKSRSRLYFVKGAFQIIQSQLLLALVFKFSSLEFIKISENPLIHYFVFIFTVICGMKMMTGILWMFGFQVPVASYFLLLAKSPLEIWQRGSTYLAKFTFDNIYFPLWKKYRRNPISIAVTVLFVFLHLFFFHEVFLKSVMEQFNPNLLPFHFDTHLLLQQIIWLLVWLTWILLFPKIKQGVQNLLGENRGAWVLILLTHTTCALIIPLTFYLMKILSI